MGAGKTSNWSSLVNILKGHNFKMLPQVPWFQQFCFICQVADKSPVLKTANTTIIIHKEIHPQTEPVPTNHSETLTASQGFPTVGTGKAAAIPLTKCRWWDMSVFVVLWKMNTDGKASKNFPRSAQWGAVSSRY